MVAHAKLKLSSMLGLHGDLQQADQLQQEALQVGARSWTACLVQALLQTQRLLKTNDLDLTAIIA